jgi:predicted ABC-type ATPase
MCQTLWFFAGPNGGGKTTLAHRIIDKEKIDFLNSDDISAEICDQSQIRTGRILMKRFEDVVSSKKSFAMESTISGRGHLSLMKTVHRAGYKIIMIYTFVDNVEQNLQRVMARKLAGGHDVPEGTVKSRYLRSLRNFRETASRSDLWQLYYNGTGEYNKVAMGIHTSISIQDKSKYEMFCDIERNACDMSRLVSPISPVMIPEEVAMKAASFCR